MNPFATSLALYRIIYPSPSLLCLNTHFDDMIFRPFGRGTNTQVPFRISALYSSLIPLFHSFECVGCRMASLYVTGSSGSSDCHVLLSLAVDFGLGLSNTSLL